MTVLEFGVMHPNLPHWATARMAEGVRFSRVFDHGVKGWLTELNAGCQGVGWFFFGRFGEFLQRLVPCLLSAAGAGRLLSVAAAKSVVRVWSPDNFPYCRCAIICAADICVRAVHSCGGCVQDAFGRAELGLFSVDQACTQSASHCLVTVLAVTFDPMSNHLCR